MLERADGVEIMQTVEPVICICRIDLPEKVTNGIEEFCDRAVVFAALRHQHLPVSRHENDHRILLGCIAREGAHFRLFIEAGGVPGHASPRDEAFVAEKYEFQLPWTEGLKMSVNTLWCVGDRHT